MTNEEKRFDIRDYPVKAVVLLRKRPDMSMEEFKDYYENTHSKLIALFPGAHRYLRRYLQPFSFPADTEGSDAEPGGGADASMNVETAQPYSVITEVWFTSRENANQFFAAAANHREITEADEENLFDRSASVSFMVDERFTDLGDDPSRYEP